MKNVMLLLSLLPAVLSARSDEPKELFSLDSLLIDTPSIEYKLFEPGESTCGFYIIGSNARLLDLRNLKDSLNILVDGKTPQLRIHSEWDGSVTFTVYREDGDQQFLEISTKDGSTTLKEFLTEYFKTEEGDFIGILPWKCKSW